MKTSVSMAIVIAFTALGGFSLWYWGAPNDEFLRQQERFRQNRDGIVAAPGDSFVSESATIARRYASALQAGDCARVIAMTWWMEERLRFAMQSGEETRGAAMEDLCDALKTRNAAGNQFRLEGVEDQYVFAPMAQVEVMGLDSGEQDLAKPVMERVWMRVSYPASTQSLKDERGTPIKSLRVGVNVSTDGYVLKAGVIGNLEIDFESISYNW